MRKTAPLAMLAVALVAACTGYKPYANGHEKNVRIVTRTEGSLLSSMRTAVDVYRVDGACRTSYQGTLQLRGPATLVGLPEEQQLYLVFVFEGSSLLGSAHNTISYDTVFRAGRDTDYEFTVSYADKIYGVEMRSIAGAESTPVASQRLSC